MLGRVDFRGVDFELLSWLELFSLLSFSYLFFVILLGFAAFHVVCCLLRFFFF
jgi:hypothetical protein